MGNIKQDIRKQVLDQLQWDNRVEIEDLEVDVMEGRLSMRGTVPSYDTLRAAEESVYVIPGIHSVDNSLIIKYPEDITVPTDEDIRSTVENTLKWNNNLNADSIDVNVEEGLVVLEGKTDKYWKKRLAEDITLSTVGVTSVDNKIKVEPYERVLDEIIAQDVKAALERNYQIEAQDIDVEVKDGIVKLTGVVPDFNASRAAYVSALYTNGVNEVRNDIQVKTL